MSALLIILILIAGVIGALVLAHARANRVVTKRPGYLIGPQDRERLP